MNRRTIAAVGTVALAATALPGVGNLTASASFQPETVNTPNMSWVANLEYDVREGYEPLWEVEDPALGEPVAFPFERSYGTDLELISYDVDHDLNPLTPKVTRDFAVAGSYRNGMQLIDVTDPTNPTIATTYDCGMAQGDVQIFQRTVDGELRTYAAYGQDDISSHRLATSRCFVEGFEMEGYEEPVGPDDGDVVAADGGVAGTFIVDITDPYDVDAVRLVGWARWTTGSHNTTVDPSGRYIYNSNQDLLPYFPGADQSPFQVEVFEIGDPDAEGFMDVELVGTAPLSVNGPHDITFSADGDRAYVAAIAHTVVLDTTDKANPKVLGQIVDPAISIHHQADPIPIKHPVLGDRTYLVISDELAGVIQGAGSCPGGGLHVYDITGELELAPVKVGVFEIPQASPSTQWHLRCTAHVFKTYDLDGDGGHDRMTIAWYGAGVRVIDLNGLAGTPVGASVGAEVAGTLPTGGMTEIGSIYLPEIAEVDADGNKTYTQYGSQTWAAKVLEWEADGSAYIFANDLDRGLDVYRFDAMAAMGAPGTWMTPEAALDLAVERGVTAAKAEGIQFAPYCVVIPKDAVGYQSI